MDVTTAPIGALPPVAPRYRLYSPTMVAAATFCGSALAGGYLLFLNSRRLNDGKAPTYVAVALVFTLLTVGLAFVLPDGVPATGLAVGAMVGMRAFAVSMQGQAYREHLANGGLPDSGWKVAGVTLISCGFLLSLIFAGMWFTMPSLYRSGIDEVLYSRGLQEKDAAALSETLKRLDLFSRTDHGTTVYLWRQSGTVHIGFVMQDGAWNEKETCDSFRALGPEISKDAFGGSPVKIDLLDDQGEVKARL